MKKEEIKEEEEIPTFTPPSEEEIPTFKAPSEDEIPTFKAPTNSNFTGATCYHHPTEPAVGVCVRCGRNICKDCAESCAVDGGEYAGKNLCYDCCKQLFEEDEAKLKKDKNTIMIQYVLTIIGVIIGAFLGISTDGGVVMALIFAVIGGSFLAAFKPICSSLGDIFKGVFNLASGESIFEGIIQFFVGIGKFLIVVVECTIRTSIKLVKYTIYIVKAEKAIKADREAIQQLQDFMQYMNAIINNKGVDLETLMQEGSELYNNSYARELRDHGEEAADQMLRQATTTIAENGEIIRSFVAA